MPPTPASSQVSVGWTWASSEPDGAPSPSPRSTPTPAPSSPSDGRESRTSVTSQHLPVTFNTDFRTSHPRADGTTEPIGAGHRLWPHVLTGSPPPSGQAASRARTSASLASAGAWEPEPGADSPTASSLWSNDTTPVSSCSRTFRDFSPVMAGATWQRSSVRWSNSGMAWDTGCSTLATSECRSADGECSSSESRLADVLEPSSPPRFYLSARAAAGILRRASKRGRELPRELERALSSLAKERASDITTPMTTSSPTSSEPSTTSDTTVGQPMLSRSTLGTSSPSSEPDTEQQVTETNASSSSVRRLTPTETERLMGWPDGHTIVHNWKSRDR